MYWLKCGCHLGGIIVAIGPGIVAGKDDTFKVEVVTSGRYPFASIIEDRGIELRGRVNISIRQNDTVEFHELNCGASDDAWVLLHRTGHLHIPRAIVQVRSSSFPMFPVPREACRAFDEA